jgi:hypothetical protein
MPNLVTPAPPAPVGELDAALTELLAVLPDGWLDLRLTKRRHSAIGPWCASVHDGSGGAMAIRSGVALAHGSRPDIAVRRLAARLTAEPTPEPES